MSESRAIQVTAHRTPDGRPTCCAHWHHTRCRFLRTRIFGTVPHCGALAEDLHRETESGYIIPADGCPVWGDSTPHLQPTNNRDTIGAA